MPPNTLDNLNCMGKGEKENRKIYIQTCTCMPNFLQIKVMENIHVHVMYNRQQCTCTSIILLKYYPQY